MVLNVPTQEQTVSLESVRQAQEPSFCSLLTNTLRTEWTVRGKGRVSKRLRRDSGHLSSPRSAHRLLAAIGQVQHAEAEILVEVEMIHATVAVERDRRDGATVQAFRHAEKEYRLVTLAGCD